MEDIEAGAAESFLRDHPDTRERFERVAQLIEGFETPFGVELMATVHWVATRERAVQDPDAAYLAVQAWNMRKADMMRREHIRAAWMRLPQLRWLDQHTSAE